MTEVEIEYRVPCSLLDDATMVQRHLLTGFGETLDRASLVTGDAGISESRVADRLDPVEASP